jgi:tRNA(His) guanylyltransferase
MKKYEKITSFQIPPRTYTIIRFDGRGFSGFTKKMDKPFDHLFSMAMDLAAKAVAKEFNAKLAYTQSDEISIMLTDIENINSELPFDGKIQKLCSIGATVVANEFNRFLLHDLLLRKGADLRAFNDFKFAEFDARVFSIPDFREVSNYFIWRQRDATRNSISMAAHHTKGISTNNKKSNELQEELFQMGINWNDYDTKFKRGVVIARELYEKPVEGQKPVIRSRWACQETPIFTEDREFLHKYIPIIT